MKSETPRKATPLTKAGTKATKAKRDTGVTVAAIPAPAEIAPSKRSKTKTESVIKPTPVTPVVPVPAPVAKKVTTAKTVPVVKLPVTAAKLAPTYEEIAKRAYEIYLGRGPAEGSAAQDWLQAEQELLARQNN